MCKHQLRLLKDVKTETLQVRLPNITSAVWYVAGLETDGIYRVSGNLAVIQKLRFLVNHGEDEGHGAGN